LKKDNDSPNAGGVDGSWTHVCRKQSFLGMFQALARQPQVATP